MRITNHYNLPEAIFQAVKAWNYPPKEGRYSVTELIAPPLIKRLKIEHWDKLTEDASDRLWALLGQAVHAVLDKIDMQESLQEEKLIQEFDGTLISGRVDLYHWLNRSIEDYKITSVWSFIFGDKPEWEAQLNLYRWLYEKYGFEVEKLQIHAILRDWKQSEALKNRDYPSIAFHTVDIPLWSIDDTERYIADRIEKHKAGATCTKEERWLRDEQWAVMKEGNKRALKLFNNPDDAELFKVELEKQNKKALISIEHRKGQYVRCESYCPVRTVCTEKNNYGG